MVGRTALLAAMVLSAGCTHLTDFDGTVSGGVSVFSCDDLTPLATLGTLEGARSICVTPSCLFVASTEGRVYSYQLQHYTLETSVEVGEPSASGYYEMEYSPQEGSVYLVGAMGQLVEFSVPGGEVLDVFTACQNPVDIEVAHGKPYFYLADAGESRIVEVRMENNAVSRICPIPSVPTCMTIDQSDDSILVGTLEAPELVATGNSGTIGRRTMDKLPMITSLSAVPEDTTICAVFHLQVDEVGIIPFFFPPAGVYYHYLGLVGLEGSLHRMCVDETGTHAFVLSFIGDDSSRLVSYDCDNWVVDNQVVVSGFPLDIDCADGEVFVLTTE